MNIQLEADMLTVILLLSLFAQLPGQESKPMKLTEDSVMQDSDGLPFSLFSECSQPAEEREALIKEAVENKYMIMWVVFVGNEHTRDRVLRRRIMLQEGDVFTRENLVKSLKNVSRLKKIIYPVKLSDVTIRLDRPEKIINIAICFKEKRR